MNIKALTDLYYLDFVMRHLQQSLLLSIRKIHLLKALILTNVRHLQKRAANVLERPKPALSIAGNINDNFKQIFLNFLFELNNYLITFK